jgi:hypothetical protein
MPSSSRPLIVSLLAIVCFAVAGVFGFNALNLLPDIDFNEQQSRLRLLWSLGNAGLGILLGVGLWRCRRWGWWLTVILMTLACLQSIWQLLSKGDAFSSSDRLLTLALPFRA